MTNACVPAAHYNHVAQRLLPFTFLFFTFYLMALLCFAQPALAMGSAPAKPQPKYKLEVLKLEVIRGSTGEVTHKLKK